MSDSLSDVFNLPRLYLEPFGDAYPSRMILYGQYPLSEGRFQALLDTANENGDEEIICAPTRAQVGAAYAVGECDQFGRGDYGAYAEAYLPRRGHVITSVSNAWGVVIADSDLLVAGGIVGFADSFRRALEERNELPRPRSGLPEADEVRAFHADRAWFVESELGRENPGWPDTLLQYVYGEDTESIVGG